MHWFNAKCAFLWIIPCIAVAFNSSVSPFPSKYPPFNQTKAVRRLSDFRGFTDASSSPAADYVKLKLQSFIFEVHRFRRDDRSEATAHLKRLIKRHEDVPLDPGYTSDMITDYHPLSIQAKICSLFPTDEKTRNSRHLASSIFVVNDIGAMVNRPRHDRLLQLFFQITASLGIPTITWMPNRIGEFEVRRWMVWDFITQQSLLPE